MKPSQFRRPWHRTLLALICVAALVPAFTTAAQAAPLSLTELKGQLAEFMRLGYAQDVERTLDRMTQLDAVEGERWQKITDYWNDALTDFEITGAQSPADPAGVPDGLPNDWSHVFVVLGHVLNNDGTPEQKLIDRLTVAKTAAQKYPNTRIVVTGGQPRNGVREGEVMRDWLIAEGIDEDRIIMEDQSADTPDNSTMTMDILYGLTGTERVDSYTLITSATHVRRGAIQYYEASLLEQKDSGADHTIEPLGNATHMDSFAEERYPGDGERDLIAQNVAKVASWDTRDDVTAVYNNFRLTLRHAHAKIVYYMSKGLAADALRAAGDASDISLTIATQWPATIRTWSQALQPMQLNAAVPADLPTSHHAFVLLGAGEADRMDARYALTQQGLDTYPNSIVILAGNSSEISNSYSWLTSNGVPAGRIVSSSAGSNAQQGAVNATNALIALGDTITTYTMITSGNYLRRPAALYAVAALIRGLALRADNVPTPVGHIVETHVGDSAGADGNAPTSENMIQIAANSTDIITCQGEYNSYVSNPPPTSTLVTLVITNDGPGVVVVGDQIDPDNFSITGSLSNSTGTAEIDLAGIATLTVPSTSSVGTKTVSASYEYAGVSLTSTVDLVVRADVSDLVATLAQLDDIDFSRYTPQSAAALEQAMAAAQSLVDDLNASVVDVTNALAALEAAINSLVTLAPEVRLSLSSVAVNGWHRPGTTFTITATSALADVTIGSVEYRTTGGWTTYTQPVVLPEGRYTLGARATDSLGRTSDISLAVAVGLHGAPTVTVRALRAKIGKVKVTKGKLRAGKKARIRVIVKGVAAHRPTGKVVLRVGKKKVGSAKLKKLGKRAVAVVRTKKLKKGKITVRYQGSKIYQSATKKFKKVKR